MSSGGTGLDAPVVRRIRVLTAIAAIVSVLVLVGVVWGALDDLDMVEGAPLGVDDPNDAPWDRAAPQELTIADDGTLQIPAGGGVLHVPQSSSDPVLKITTTGEPSDWVDVSLTPDGVVRDDDEYFYPDSAGDIFSEGDTVMLFPGARDLEVWFESEAAETLRVAPLEVDAMGATASGEGDATLLYEGEHISARAVHRGDGVFFLDTFTPGGRDSPVIESGDVDERFSWDGSPVVFVIESSGPWTLQIDGETAP